MRREHDGQSRRFAEKLPQSLPIFSRTGHFDVDQRFIEYQNSRIARQGAHQGCAGTLSLRKMIGEFSDFV
jgi:hypothetical protein